MKELPPREVEVPSRFQGLGLFAQISQNRRQYDQHQLLIDQSVDKEDEHSTQYAERPAQDLVPPSIIPAEPLIDALLKLGGHDFSQCQSHHDQKQIDGYRPPKPEVQSMRMNEAKGSAIIADGSADLPKRSHHSLVTFDL